jgi:hypothetical protein
MACDGPTVDYLQEHRVEAFVHGMVDSLKHSKPGNPFKAMAEYAAQHKDGVESEAAERVPAPGTTGLLDSTEGASTTQYVAPQSTVGAIVTGSSSTDVWYSNGSATPPVRGQAPTMPFEPLEATHWPALR